jgi:hypothetical protein
VPATRVVARYSESPAEVPVGRSRLPWRSCEPIGVSSQSPFVSVRHAVPGSAVGRYAADADWWVNCGVEPSGAIRPGAGSAGAMVGILVGNGRENRLARRRTGAH